MPGLFYEQFTVGQVFDHPWGRTITEADNTLFSLMTMNPQPLHLDAEESARTEFGQRLVNSLFTLGLMVGMSVNDTTYGTTIANLGFTDVRFSKPVFHGDTLRVRTTVESMRESRSRPDAGILVLRHTACNQRQEEVATCLRTVFVRRQPGAASTAGG